MAKISELPPLPGSLTLTDIVPVNRDGDTYSAPLGLLTMWYPMGIAASANAGLEEGGDTAEMRCPFDVVAVAIDAQVTVGTGTCEVTVFVDGIAVFGPAVISPVLLLEEVAILVPAGSKVDIQRAAIVGDVRAIQVRLLGQRQ